MHSQFNDNKMQRRHCNEMNFYTKRDEDLALKCKQNFDFDIRISCSL